MARPKKIVKNKAVRKTRQKKVKNSFLILGKQYRFYIPGDDFVATLIDSNDKEFLLKDEHGEMVVYKQFVFKVHENIEETESE